MDFNGAEQQRRQLENRLRNRQITPGAFTEAINGLRVTDSAGRTWQPNPGGSDWLVWNGNTWLAGQPPVNGQGPPVLLDAAGPGQERAKDFSEFKDSLMSVDDFKKMSKDVPLAKRPQKWWDLLSILGGIVSAIIWILYSGIREGIDIITPLLMIAIPVCLVWFRTDIDGLLLPLQPYRRKFSRLVLIGCGIALPFLTAFILFTIGIRNYPLMYTNMLIGTFGAYAITRDPVTVPGQQPRRSSGSLPAVISAVAGLALISLIVPYVRADDCARDVLNAQDCLRTSGFAEVIAGIFSTLLSALVNGPVVIQSIVQGAAGSVAGAAPAVPAAPPQGPQVGDSMTYTDSRGDQHTAVLQPDGHWVTDHGTWYDPDYAALLAEGEKIDAANAAWRAQTAVQNAADAAKFTAMTEAWKAQAAQAKADLDKTSFKTWYMGYLRQEQATNMFSSAMYQNQGNIMDAAATTGEWVKYGCDKTIDVLGEVTGPVGKTIKTIYKVGTNLGAGLGEGMAEGGNYGSHLAKGAANAAVDLISDKLVDKGFEKLGKTLNGHMGGGVVNWLNKPITVNPDPLALKMFSSNKTEIAVRGIGNAAKGWLKGWGPGYGTDAVKDGLIGK